MKKTYTYEACYRILGLSPGCSWNVLRRSYKSLIHKWHPDRLSDNSLEKEIAYEKIKDINVAYNQLYRFYRKNNILPPIKITDKPEAGTPDQQTDQQAAVHAKAQKSGTKSCASQNEARSAFNTWFKSSFRALAYLSLMVVFTFTSLYFIHTQTIDQSIQKADIEFHNQPNQHKSGDGKLSAEHAGVAHPQDDNSPDELTQHIEVEERYFTDGDNIGKVIEAQGIPDRTEGDIWYYGKSEVHFKNGRVSHWLRTTKNPLKARVYIRAQTNKLPSSIH